MHENNRHGYLPAALILGGLLTLATALIPLIDHLTVHTVADHIANGYPDYSDAEIDSAATVYLVYLIALGLAGTVGWGWTLRLARRSSPWTGYLAAGLCATGWAIGLFNALVRDTSGDVGLPPLIGWIGLLPAVVGLVVLATLWPGRHGLHLNRTGRDTRAPGGTDDLAAS
ncbi:hypothetical protein [Gordonia bronchialis]|uniref:hypothetical protein n=1 Tax=Gordonia bronchialis TaxID=2054 RepID=UPI00227013E2|nr:hypothetical protein [Gordonia bronchialis]